MTQVVASGLAAAAESPRPTIAGEPRASRLVDRPRLVARLRSLAENHRLTVVTAPAGYGKSVLLDQWLAHPRTGPVKRVTMRRDDDARRAAAAADLGSVEGGILVVDALDAPVDAAVVEGVRGLIRGLPPGVHAVVAQRSRWPAGDGASEARRERVGLDEVDLAFTPEEVRRLVRQVAGRDLSAGQIEDLLARTEGWAVGLHLAAIALRRPVPAEEVIESLGGDVRYVEAYLVDEVLAALPPRIRRFLARTSVLDRLCGALCDALTGATAGDGDRMLRDAEARGLFTRRLITAGEAWFRYHPLLREVLRRELRRSEPDAGAALLAHAAAWHLARDEIGPAATYLIEAGDGVGLIELVDRCGRAMFERGDADQVLRWLDALPGSSDPHRTELAVRRAYLHTIAGQLPVADQVLREIDAAALSPGEGVVVDALRAAWAFWDGRPEAALRAANAALSALHGPEPAAVPDILGLTSPESLRIMAAGARARVLWYLGDVGASRRALVTLCDVPDTYPPWRARALGTLALVEAWAGNLCIATEAAGRSLAVATAAHLLNHPSSLDARVAIAHVARERGELQRADALLTEVLALATRAHVPVTLTMHALERALWHLATGHAERGLAELARSRGSGRPSPPPAIEARERAAEVRLLAARGDTRRAAAVLDEAVASGTPAPALAAVDVQVAVQQHDLGAAAAHIDRWQPDGSEPRARLERELWTAVVDAERGDRRQARERATGVVAEARAEGHVRLFLDAGRPVDRLLRSLRQAAPTPYLDHLVACARSSRRARAGDAAAGLTERELEVVRYLPTPLSNGEIAARLYVSVNTLKTHLRTAYRKLGVTGRQDAIERTQELGIA